MFLYMRIIVNLLLLLCVCVSSTQAQKRYVVAFDCTKSMNHPSGDYSDNGLDASILWEPAKNCIRSLWVQASPNDEFVILLFQEDVLDKIQGYKGVQLSDWNSIERRMEDAIKIGGNTCILNAWKTAERYFTANCDFYFITDGVEDHDNNNQINEDEQAHINAICDKIDKFCNLGINGFYTNLKQSENDIINNQISRKIKESCFKDLIAGKIVPLELSLNQEDINKGRKTFNLSFKPIDKNRLANVKNLYAQIVEVEGYYGLQKAGDYFNFGISGIKNNNIEFTIEQIKAVPQDLLDNANSCKFFVNIGSVDKNVAIFPEQLTVNVRYYYEKIAYLPSQELEGTSKYHPAFFIKLLANLLPQCDFIAEHKPDTIVFDLKHLLNDNTLFNNEAIRLHSSYKLKLVPVRDRDKHAQITLLKNGEPCSNNVTEILSSDNNIIIGVVFNKSVADGTYKFILEPVEPMCLDKINEYANIHEASIPLLLKFDIEYNPFNFLLFVLLVLFILFTFVMFSWKNLFTRKIMDKQICLIPDIYNPIADVNNCVKCVITRNRLSGRNSLLHRIYFGPIQYVNIPEAVSDIVLTTNFDDEIIVHKNISYDMNNMPLISNMIAPQGVNNQFEHRDQKINFTIVIN